jgi:hypothetical protein
MNIRSYCPSDIEELKSIHSKYFKDEFELPDFFHGFMCAFSVEDEKGLVTIGGIRPIIEVIAVTNKDRSVRVRREALYNLLQALSFVAKTQHHDQIHAFVQDKKWLGHLQKVGFNPTKGQALVLGV